MTAPLPIFILANDKVLARLLILLASLKHFDFKNEIFIIPFDDNMAVTKEIAQGFGLKIYEDTLDDVRKLSRRIYDRDPPANPYPTCLGNLHKLAFLSYPGKAVYLDSDIALTNTSELFNDVFDTVRAGGDPVTIGYINTSPTGVYEEVAVAAELRSKSHYICAGMISKSEGTVAISELESFFSEEQISLYHRVRRRGGHVDQPVWNFLVDSQFLAGRDLLADSQISRVTSPNQTGVLFDENGCLTVGGKSILLFHMAGPLLKTAQG